MFTNENWEDHYRTNVKGGFFVSKQVAPIMIKNRWGRIIWISSQSGLIGIRRAACLLLNKRSYHTANKDIRSGMGETWHNGQFRCAHLRRNKSDQKATAKSAVSEFRSK